MPKKLSDTSKNVRQQKIYNILRHYNDEENSILVSEIHKRLLSEDLDTSQKTIHRDLLEMSVSHMIEATETKPTRYYCSGEYEPNYQLTFNESELVTMALALLSLKEMSDSFQKSLCEKTEAILLSKLPKEIATDFEILKSYTIVSPGLRAVAGVENGSVYKIILKALKEGRVIQCENHSPYKPKEYRQTLRSFSPLKLHMVGGEQYLIVLDHADQKMKRLKVCRMKNITIQNEKVDKKLLQNLDDLEASIGGYGSPDMPIHNYKIHCDELMAVLFQEKKMHPSQKVIENNGSYIISFEANPSIEISRYLAGWAKHISRVEPEDVYQEMKDIWETGLGAGPKKAA